MKSERDFSMISWLWVLALFRFIFKYYTFFSCEMKKFLD